MKKKLLSILTCFLFSCSNQHEVSQRNLEKDLFTFFNTGMKDQDSTMHLDSVRILKFDTITAKTLSFRKIMSLYDQVDANQKKFAEALDKRADARKMMRLSAGLSSALYNNSLDDYNKNNEELILLNKQDSLLMKSADSLREKIESVDSTNLLYLQVKCLIQYQRKDLSVNRDTVYAFLNSDKKIVRSDDIFKD